MITYNITAKVDPSIANEWLQWQQEEHIPEIMALGLFTSYKIFRLLEQDEEDGVTYIIQYTTASMQQYKHYVDAHAALTRKKAFNRWGDRFIAFRSVMEVIH
jgi:hypothetical protein